jgi:hypothetical protein
VTKGISHYGRAVVAAASLWGVGIALFGATASLALAALGLIIAGAHAISAIFRQTMWNESIPPDVRGRMAGIEMIRTTRAHRWAVSCWSMAAWWGLRVSLALGGSGLGAGNAPRLCHWRCLAGRGASTRAPTPTSRSRNHSSRRRPLVEIGPFSRFPHDRGHGFDDLPGHRQLAPIDRAWALNSSTP